MFTPEMLASVKKVEATRQERLGMEPRRMTAEEKDALLKAYHPDYREDGFDTIKIGPNKGEKVPKELLPYTRPDIAAAVEEYKRYSEAFKAAKTKNGKM